MRRAILLAVLASACAASNERKPAPEARRSDSMAAVNLKASIGKRVTLKGTAGNAKGGAVVVTTSGSTVYLVELDEWPPELEGRAVEVSGRLDRKQHIPEATTDPVTGAISAGARGKQWVLEGAVWKGAD